MNCPHCNIEIDSHPASRCLDALIAEKVIEVCSHFLEFEWTDKEGDRYCKCDKCGETIKHPELKLYSEEISAAWDVIENMRKKHILLPIWELSVLGDFPLRVCRAALEKVSNEL